MYSAHSNPSIQTLITTKQLSRKPFYPGGDRNKTIVAQQTSYPDIDHNKTCVTTPPDPDIDHSEAFVTKTPYPDFDRNKAIVTKPPIQTVIATIQLSRNPSIQTLIATNNCHETPPEFTMERSVHFNVGLASSLNRRRVRPPHNRKC